MLCFSQTQGSISLLRKLLKTATFLLASLPPSLPLWETTHMVAGRRKGAIVPAMQDNTFVLP